MKKAQLAVFSQKEWKKVNTDSRMALFTKVNSGKSKDMATAFKLGQMEPDMKVNGLTIWPMDVVCFIM
jgi:hypothetical protein